MVNSARPRLTIIAGAGASFPDGGPTAVDLTARLFKHLTLMFYPRSVDLTRHKPNMDDRLDVGQLLRRGLDSGFKSADFEILLDTLEQLKAIAPSYSSLGVADDFRSPLSSFLEPSKEYRPLLDQIPLQIAHQDAIRFINQVVDSDVASKIQLKTPGGIGVRQLLEQLSVRYALTVVTLNYDTIIDSADVDWLDGFTYDGGGDFRSFEPTDWLGKDEGANVLIHLHGSILWGYSHVYTYQPWYEPVKYPSPNAARLSLDRGMSSSDISHGQFYGPTPIISGLNKGAKFIYNVRPYGYYFDECMRQLVAEPRLLITGYGSRDQHLNEWIIEYIKVHEERRRPAVITRIGGDEVGEKTPKHQLLNRLAGIGKFDDSFAYAEVKQHYVDAPIFQEHGALRLIPSGLPIEDPALVDRLEEFWES